MNSLKPGRKPFQDTEPALAELTDGARRLRHHGRYGQPQTQAAVFPRIAVFGMDPQQAISARVAVGRTWGQTTDSLKLESRFSTGVVADLRGAGTK